MKEEKKTMKRMRGIKNKSKKCRYIIFVDNVAKNCYEGAEQGAMSCYDIIIFQISKLIK